MHHRGHVCGIGRSYRNASSIADGTCVWDGDQGGGLTYRFGARSGISFQRGYSNIRISNFNIKGAQNSGIDMESTGTGTLRSAHLSHGLVDNTGANSSTAVSFSGSAAGPQTSDYSTFSDVEIRNGCLQIAKTLHARVSDVRIVVSAAFPSAPTTPLCTVQYDNEGLELHNLQIHRLSGADAGICLKLIGSGKTAVVGGYIEQTTAETPIYVEPAAAGMDDLRIQGTLIDYTGGSASSYNAIRVLCQSGDADRMHINGVRVTATALNSLIRIDTRGTFSARNMRIVNCNATDGAVTNGVYLSKQAGSQIDTNPIIQGNDFGLAAVMCKTVDNSDAPITTIFRWWPATDRGITC
jgi:hypothetical protein